MIRLTQKAGIFGSRIVKISNTEQWKLARMMSSLIQNQAFINGMWTNANDNSTFEVTNPANQKVVAEVPDMKVNDVQRAIDAAHDAFHSKAWQDSTGKERSGMLKKWFQLLESNKEEIASIMTAESGKPLAESMGEATYGNSFVEWFAEEARRIYGEIIPSPIASKSMMTTRSPVGVAGLITPWNFPHAMITRKAGAALAAGCTIVIRPASDTPLTALALCKLAEEAGFPAGVINVVTSRRGGPIGELLCKSPKVGVISFTGSTGVGKLLYQQCADGIKKIGLELGGNAPFIVFNSANLDKAVAGAIASKFRNCGQTCVSANRFLVQDEIFEEFVEKLTSAIKALKIGDGAECDVKVGPLINEHQMKNVSGMVKDAKEKGGCIVHGGRQLSDVGSLFYEPTVITNIKPGMLLYTEEVFGPVVSIIRFKTEDEALKIANATDVGLAGYFFSENLNQVLRVSKRMEVGMVGVNEGIISTTEAPFGGVKQSGIGREGSKHGIDEYVNIKYICIGGLD